jgi:hypothetical protein
MCAPAPYALPTSKAASWAIGQNKIIVSFLWRWDFKHCLFEYHISIKTEECTKRRNVIFLISPAKTKHFRCKLNSRATAVAILSHHHIWAEPLLLVCTCFLFYNLLFVFRWLRQRSNVHPKWNPIPYYSELLLARALWGLVKSSALYWEQGATWDITRTLYFISLCVNLLWPHLRVYIPACHWTCYWVLLDSQIIHRSFSLSQSTVPLCLRLTLSLFPCLCLAVSVSGCLCLAVLFSHPHNVSQINQLTSLFESLFLSLYFDTH